MIELKLELTNLIKPIGEFLKKFGEEWDNLIELGLYDYLYTQTEKYYYTNTFLHLTERVEFYDIYYPIRAKYKNSSLDFMDLGSVFSNYKCISIVGLAGCGKTTLVRHIFLHTIKNYEFLKKIPVIIELRNLNTYSGSFESLILEKVLKTRTEPNENIFHHTLKSGSYVFLLDGFDEIYSEKKEEIVRQIEMFIDANSNNNFIIASRPGGNIDNFPRFYSFKIEELNKEDIVNFVNLNVKNTETQNRILEIIDETKNNDYKYYLKNPLLLSMFILAIFTHPEIPSRKNIFYKNVFDTLYSRHDAHTKGSFLREKFAKLEREDYENILEKFCFIVHCERKFEFTEEYLSDTLLKIKNQSNGSYNIEFLIKDLRTQISILLQDGFIYSFPHRSMQEYFLARFISKLPQHTKKEFFKNFIFTTSYSNDNYTNLLLMLEELDKIALYKYLIIPRISSYLKVFSGMDSEIIYEYQRIGKIAIRVKRSLMNNCIGIEVENEVETTIFYNLLEYFHIKPAFRKIGEITRNHNIKDFLSIDFLTAKRRFDSISDDVSSYLIYKNEKQPKFPLIFNCFKEEINEAKNLIVKLEDIVNKEKTMIEDILSYLKK